MIPPKKVVWIDPNFSSTSPIMQRFVASIEVFKKDNWNIEVWCSHFDESLREYVDNVIIIPRGPKIIDETIGIFRILSTWKITINKLFSSDKIIYHATKGWACNADISSHNFSTKQWIKVFCSLKYKALKDWLRLPFLIVSMFWEFVELRLLPVQLIIANSDGLKDYLVTNYKLQKTKVVFVKNQIDKTRFNPKVVSEHREISRTELNYTNEDFVFSFLSQGHLCRKGWYEAANALDLYRKKFNNNHIKFLVIGPGDKVKKQAIHFLENHTKDWRSWVQFLPPSQNVQESLSASDCFLFPSFFDSCANSANEAAALGLRCIVGNYFGASLLSYLERVIVIESVNAESLIQAITDIQEMDRAGNPPLFEIDMSYATCTPNEWAEEVKKLYNQVWSQKYS